MLSISQNCDLFPTLGRFFGLHSLFLLSTDFTNSTSSSLRSVSVILRISLSYTFIVICVISFVFIANMQDRHVKFESDPCRGLRFNGRTGDRGVVGRSPGAAP